MKNKLSYLTVFTAILIWTGCDKVEFPKQGGATGPTGNPNVIVRKAFVEDYTGHVCGNCPPVGECIRHLHSTYGANLIAITVHAGGLSFPQAPPFQYDFRTVVGTNYHDTWAVQQYPTEVLNRKTWSGPTGFLIGDTNSLKARIDSIIDSPPGAQITITTNYNVGNRNLDVSVKSKFLTPVTGGFYKLAVLFVEDSVFKPQKDDRLISPSVDNNYYHRHVLRSSLYAGTSGWGDTLAFGNFNVGDSITKVCPTFTVPITYNNGTNWNCDDTNCYVIAFIYDADPFSPTHYEVIQVEEAKIR